MTREEAPELAGRFRVTRGWLFRVLGSATLLTVTLMLLPTQQVAASLRNLSWPLFLCVLLLFLASHVAAAGKWWFLLGRAIHFRSAVRAHFAGLAANLCLPGVAGGDVVRAALVMREMGQTAQLVTVSLADRLVDTLSLAMLSALGLLLLGPELAAALGIGEIAPGPLLLAVGLPILAILAAGFLFLPVLSKMLTRWAERRPDGSRARAAATAVGELAGRRAALAVALCLSCAIQGGIVGLSIMLADGVGVEAPPAVWLFAWPLAKILAVAPISLGGIGVREASLAGLMAPFGADPAGVVAASLIWQGVLFSAGAIGAAAWVLTMKSGERQVRQQALH
jgi:glycosyltransferase 2 family protein